jgi:uncharacterized membrane protein
MVMQFFQEGGYGMYVVLLLGMAGVAAAAVYASGQERMRWPAWGLAAACVVAGALFMMQGRSRTDEAIAAVDPQLSEAIREAVDDQHIRAVGYRGSQRPLQLGIGLGVLVAVISAIGEVKRRKS